MEKEKKKKYEKPRVTRIDLDAKCAVLGFCKTAGSFGPAVANCKLFGPCRAKGS
jgi:hypothetical protein